MMRETLFAACLATFFSSVALAGATSPTDPTGPGPSSPTTPRTGMGDTTLPGGKAAGGANEPAQNGAIILNGADGKMKSGEGDDPGVPKGNTSQPAPAHPPEPGK